MSSEAGTPRTEQDAPDAEASVLIVIDHSRCVGIGRCEDLEPDAVELREDGWSYPRPGVKLPRSRAERLRCECPSQAIAIEEPTTDLC